MIGADALGVDFLPLAEVGTPSDILAELENNVGAPYGDGLPGLISQDVSDAPPPIESSLSGVAAPAGLGAFSTGGNAGAHAAVPEPATAVLLVAALAGLGAVSVLRRPRR